uniref:Lipocalin/cytosolic fatty-acid binding domain-containing protein n=1 Tax=Catharus ustulatus TaxID=91951 RepID=A0A8C3V263_CATUS
QSEHRAALGRGVLWAGSHTRLHSSGRVWHVTAIASNCSIFLKMKDGMKSSMAIISFMPEGDLALNTELRAPAGPRRAQTTTLSNWSPLGSLGAQEKRDLRVMETDYSHYAVLHEAHYSEAEPSTALQLLTREQDVSPQLLQKFMQLIPTMGLTKDMLWTMGSAPTLWRSFLSSRLCQTPCSTPGSSSIS